jgi:hypothetical protein
MLSTARAPFQSLFDPAPQFPVAVCVSAGAGSLRTHAPKRPPKELRPGLAAPQVFLLLGFFLASPAQADIRFQAKPMTGAKLPSGKAQCEIRLAVDKQVEVSLHGDMVAVHTLTGSDARDNGSECSAPLPAAAMDGFRLEVRKRQGEVKLVMEPSARNDFTATVFIHGNAAGEGLYDLRIWWNTPTLPSGINSNNAFHFAARGAGKAILNDAVPVALGDVSVDIDRGGNIAVTFQMGRAGKATFTGTVMSWENGVLKMDGKTDERFKRLPGPMYVNFDAGKQVYKVAMEATNGQDQLRLTWERK